MKLKLLAIFIIICIVWAMSTVTAQDNTTAESGGEVGESTPGNVTGNETTPTNETANGTANATCNDYEMSPRLRLAFTIMVLIIVSLIFVCIYKKSSLDNDKDVRCRLDTENPITDEPCPAYRKGEISPKDAQQRAGCPDTPTDDEPLEE